MGPQAGQVGGRTGAAQSQLALAAEPCPEGWPLLVDENG
jgi:hypothetical protein